MIRSYISTVCRWARKSDIQTMNSLQELVLILKPSCCTFISFYFLFSLFYYFLFQYIHAFLHFNIFYSSLSHTMKGCLIMPRIHIAFFKKTLNPELHIFRPDQTFIQGHVRYTTVHFNYCEETNWKLLELNTYLVRKTTIFLTVFIG